MTLHWCDRFAGWTDGPLDSCPHHRRARSNPRGDGAFGVNSTNPKVQEFFATGDPAVFARPGALDYRGD